MKNIPIKIKNTLTDSDISKLIDTKNALNPWKRKSLKQNVRSRKIKRIIGKMPLIAAVFALIGLLSVSYASLGTTTANNVLDTFSGAVFLLENDEITLDEFVNEITDERSEEEIDEALSMYISDLIVIEKTEQQIFEDKLFEDTKVIGCYNKYTKTSRVADKCTKGGDHNISIPPKSHLQKWRDIGWNDREIVNRFPIVNFESNFREYVGNPYAYGYVQTLRKYNIAPEITPQLQWMFERQKYQKMKFSSGGSKRCGIYADEYNYKDGFEAGEEGVMACLYRFHYHAYKGMWYAKKAMSARQIYINYFYNQ